MVVGRQSYVAIVDFEPIRTKFGILIDFFDTLSQQQKLQKKV